MLPDLTSTRGFILFRNTPSFPFQWWFRFGRGSSTWAVEIPVWVLVVPSLLITAVAWRNDILVRRRERAVRLNRCPNCNYDRTGLAAGAACPECGVTPLQESAERPARDDTDAHR